MIVKVRRDNMRENMRESSVTDLLDVTTGQKIVVELTREGKYCYLTKRYCPKGQNSLFRKQRIKRGETKNLAYQHL